MDDVAFLVIEKKLLIFHCCIIITYIPSLSKKHLQRAFPIMSYNFNDRIKILCRIFYEIFQVYVIVKAIRVYTLEVVNFLKDARDYSNKMVFL